MPKDEVTLDWAAVASLLGEGVDRPIAVLDREGRLRLMNRAMEVLLGRSRFDAEGEAWQNVCVCPDDPEASRYIEDALRGAIRSLDLVYCSAAGARTSLRLEFSPVGRGAHQCLLIAVVRAEPVLASEGAEYADVDYEISVVGPEFGRLSRCQADGQPVPISDADARCYAVLHRSERPCADCPVLGYSDASWPRILVRRQDADRGGSFQVIVAKQLESPLVHIRSRTFTGEMLEAVHNEKLTRLAETADLSRREREILHFLVLGRSIDDIASATGIASRTVKHHQARVLQKLGADSRADLIRLLF